MNDKKKQKLQTRKEKRQQRKMEDPNALRSQIAQAVVDYDEPDPRLWAVLAQQGWRN